MAVLEETGWGAEFDFGYADSGDEPGEGLEAQSYMLNAIIVRPKGRLRPFGVAGAGVIHAETCVAACAGATTWTDFGFNGGGGRAVPLQRVFGLRGDVRYFAALGIIPIPHARISASGVSPSARPSCGPSRPEGGRRLCIGGRGC